MAELGDYDVLYANADQDAAKQQQQAESALTSGAGVLVLDPVDANAAGQHRELGERQGVPVVSYDRLIAGGDLAYYISFDNEKVGVLQATAFVEGHAAMPPQDGSGILMVNGSPTDSNAALFKRGAHSVIDDSGLRGAGRVRHPGVEPREGAGVGGRSDRAARRRDRRRLRRQRRHRRRRDRGAAASANVDPLPVVTGSGCRALGDPADPHRRPVHDGVQGDQAAGGAGRRGRRGKLLHGEEVTAPLEIDGTPATLLEPVAVTVDNIMDTVVADGFWSVDDICTPAYADACEAAGIG